MFQTEKVAFSLIFIFSYKSMLLMILLDHILFMLKIDNNFYKISKTKYC